MPSRFPYFYTTVVLISVELLRTHREASKRIACKDTMKGLFSNGKFKVPFPQLLHTNIFGEECSEGLNSLFGSRIIFISLFAFFMPC